VEDTNDDAQDRYGSGSQKKEGNHRFVMVTLQSLASIPSSANNVELHFNFHLYLIWRPKHHSGWQMMPWSEASKD
jgi:hypothetical protein